MSTERPSCRTAVFRIGDNFYQHRIFHTERDQVELIDSEGETILEFSSDLIVKAKTGVIGTIHREGNTWVYHERPLQTRVVCPEGMDLLHFEAEISKRYILANMVESEGGLTD
jgi:hypothetical protein